MLAQFLSANPPSPNNGRRPSRFGVPWPRHRTRWTTAGLLCESATFPLARTAAAPHSGAAGSRGRIASPRRRPWRRHLPSTV